MVSRHEAIIPKIQGEVGLSLPKVISVLAEVDRKIEEFQDWVNCVKTTDMTAKTPMEIVNTLNDIIMYRSPAASMEYVHEHLEHLEGAIRADQETTEHVRSAMIELQDKIANPSFNTLEVRDYDLLGGMIISDQGERDIVRKEIKRLEKQILQLIVVLIS